MESDTTPQPRHNGLVAAVTLVVVASTAVAGVNMAAVGIASAEPTGIDSCTTIDESGVYELTSDVTLPDVEASSYTCFRITASDVTLDGNGYAINGSDDPVSDWYPQLVAVEGSDTLTNVTVRDVRLRNNHDHAPFLEFDNVSNGAIRNVHLQPYDTTDTTGWVEVVGDDNTVTDLTGHPAVTVVGDDNRVVDSVAPGLDVRIGVEVDGDRNLVTNVTAEGWPAAVSITGADNRLLDSTTDAYLSATAIHLVEATGTEVVNNTVSGGSDGLSIHVENSTESAIVGNTMTNEYGIALEGSDDNTIRGNTGFTLGFDADSESNLVYDNRILEITPSYYAPFDVVFDESNRFNVFPRPGENVVGGDTVGGNYYASYDPEDGYSDTCADADGDDICDSPYRIGENNTDYAPLADPAPAPVVNGRTPTDPDGDGRYEDVDGDGEFAYDDVIVFFEHFRDAAVQNHPDAYDFDGSGDVTYNDVVTLFEEV